MRRRSRSRDGCLAARPQASLARLLRLVQRVVARVALTFDAEPVGVRSIASNAGLAGRASAPELREPLDRVQMQAADAEYAR